MIEGSSAMEDTKMIAEDVIEEHNGVYGGKWHIVSPEGFDLPEGLEYLKNSWEADRPGKARTHKYVASIKISGVLLKDAFEGLACVLCEFKAYDTNLEIKNCAGNSNGISINCLSKITYFAKDVSIHGCQLTLEELSTIMCGACIMSTAFERSNSYSLSGNVFTDRSLSQWKQLKHFLQDIKSSETPFKIFDLRGCNFSALERKDLMQEADFLNLLV